jgi:hypothetical protein
MTPTLKDYIATGRALEVDERLEAARELLLSVDADAEADRARIESEWGDTVERRMDEVLAGEATLIDGRAGLDRLRSELAARHR